MNTLTDFINAAGGAAGGVLGALNQPKTVVNNAPAPSPAPMEKIGPKEIALFALLLLVTIGGIIVAATKMK